MSKTDSRDAVAAAIIKHYRQSDEEHRLSHDIGPLEKERTHELLQRYLPPVPASVCDVGGAAGAYSFWMAERGHKVTLVDIVPLHIEQAEARQARSSSAKLVAMRVADARDLPFESGSFDSVLMHGPLYHLTQAGDRRKALEEAKRVLKPKGRLIAVGITRYASLIYALTAGEIWNNGYLSMLKGGLETGLHCRGFAFNTDKAVDVYFHLPDELKAEIESIGFTAEECLGVVGPGWLAKDFEANWKEPARREAILEIARWTEREPVLGPRIMVVASKKAQRTRTLADGSAPNAAANTPAVGVAERLSLRGYWQVSDAAYVDYIQEWEATGERIVPSSSKRQGCSFQEMMSRWKTDETSDACKSGHVPSTLYFLVQDDSRLVGAIHFRHELNDRLQLNGGNIGYGVRPTERRKGYATVMLAMLLEMLRKRNVGRVLITCDEDNLASVRTIESARGALQDKIPFEGVMTRRYWIRL